jgi:hypothetical protein
MLPLIMTATRERFKVSKWAAHLDAIYTTHLLMTGFANHRNHTRITTAEASFRGSFCRSQMWPKAWGCRRSNLPRAWMLPPFQLRIFVTPILTVASYIHKVIYALWNSNITIICHA